jgi:hypothetical protein
MDERRKHARQRTFKGGRINLDRGPGMDCIIRNLSEGGACLDIEGSFLTQGQFQLVIKPQLLTRICRVAWRTSARTGVQFI